jgi:hypothetical protein
VGLALVAVGVDPPLSEHDIALFREVYQYTPHVALLLTKIDILKPSELEEVEAFVREQLKRKLGQTPRIFRYSVRPGFEDLRERLNRELFAPAASRFEDRKMELVNRKLETLLTECRDYLMLALKSAEALDSERAHLKNRILGEKDSLDRQKLALKVITQHLAARTRQRIEKQLQQSQTELEQDLIREMEIEFPKWTKSIAKLMNHYTDWLSTRLTQSLGAVSASKRKEFSEPVGEAQQHLARSLQDFRDRLSDRTMRAFGFPLRTSEVDMRPEEPKTPDIHVGKVFDHNWELISFLIPMWLVKPLVRRHLLHETAYEIEKNLSRLAAQWEESINTVLFRMEKQAKQRLDDIVSTIDRLLSTANTEAPLLREDLERIAGAHEFS